MQEFKQAGHHHIQGDSTQKISFERVMGNDQAKLILADPPYCLLTRRRKKGDLRDPRRAKIEHEAVTRFENIKEYRHFTHKWMEAASSYLEDDGIFCIWTNLLGKEPIAQVAEELGFKYFWGEFIWVKLSSEKQTNEKLGRIYEVAMVFSKKAPPVQDLNSAPDAWSLVSSYDDFKKGDDWGSHPNHKSFNVIEPLLRRFSKVGEIVLDPFTGSGSTPEACIRMKRIIRGIELRDEWANMSQKRMAAELRKTT